MRMRLTLEWSLNLHSSSATNQPTNQPTNQTNNQPNKQNSPAGVKVKAEIGGAAVEKSYSPVSMVWEDK